MTLEKASLVIEFLLEELEELAQIKGREGRRAQWVIDKAKSMLGTFGNEAQDRLLGEK